MNSDATDTLGLIFRCTWACMSVGYTPGVELMGRRPYVRSAVVDTVFQSSTLHSWRSSKVPGLASICVPHMPQSDESGLHGIGALWVLGPQRKVPTFSCPILAFDYVPPMPS